MIPMPLWEVLTFGNSSQVSEFSTICFDEFLMDSEIAILQFSPFADIIFSHC